MPLLEKQVDEILETFVDSLNRPEQGLRQWVRHHLSAGEFFAIFAEIFEPSAEFSEYAERARDESEPCGSPQDNRSEDTK